MIITPPVNFSQIAQTAYVNALPQISLLYYLDDNSCIYFVTAVINGLLQIYVIDKSGVITLYGYYTNSYVKTVIPLGSGFFFVGLGNGDSFIQQFYNAKLNNTSPLIIRKQTNVSNPCYSGNPQFFYDRIQNILAVGFYDPAGQYGGPVFASLYSPTKRGLILLQSGFVGYYSDAPVYDPFNQTAVTVPSNLTSYDFNTTQSNGLMASLYKNQYGAYVVGATNHLVNKGAATDCVTPSGASVSIAAAYYNTTTGASYANTASAFDSNVPGITACNVYINNTYALELFIYSNAAYLVPHNLGANVNFVLTKTGNLFAADAAATFPNNGIYLANFQKPLTISNFGVSSHMLINAHRPVSIFGRYKA